MTLLNLAAQIKRVKRAFLAARYGPRAHYSSAAETVAQLTAEEFVAMHRAAHDDAPVEEADADARLARYLELDGER